MLHPKAFKRDVKIVIFGTYIYSQIKHLATLVTERNLMDTRKKLESGNRLTRGRGAVVAGGGVRLAVHGQPVGRVLEWII
jgi:hypothetical protein